MQTYQSVHVHNSKSRPGIPSGDEQLIRRAIGKYLVQRGNLLFHPIADLCDILRLRRPIPRFRPSRAALFRHGIQRRQLQRSQIHEHKMSPSFSIDCIQGMVHAVDVRGHRRVSGLRVCQEAFVAEVIGANPNGKHGGLWRSPMKPIICEKGGDFVLQHGRIWNLRSWFDARCDGVGAGSTANSVVRYICACLF